MLVCKAETCIEWYLLFKTLPAKDYGSVFDMLWFCIIGKQGYAEA